MRFTASTPRFAALGAALIALAACSSSSSPPPGGARDASIPDAGGAPDVTTVDGAAHPDAPSGEAGQGDAAYDPNARNTSDLPDDFPGSYQLHVLYVQPSDHEGPKPLDTDGTLRRAVTAFNGWLAYRAGGPKLRVDTYHGVIDVTYVKLPAPDTEQEMAEGMTLTPNGPAFVRDRLEAILKTTFNDPKKLYLTYWDGLAFARCGGSAYPPSLPGHFTAQYVGGVFDATFLTAAAPAGSAMLSVYSTVELPLPQPPFSAMLGGEMVTVAQVQTNMVTLLSATTQAHAAGVPLEGQTSIPPCRSNPFSSDGKQLNYWEYSGVHECMHPLGIVSANALDFAPPPVAPGHLAASNPAGVDDLMYQGVAGWGCPSYPAPADPTTSTCQLDPQHRNYFHPSVAGAADLATSVFLDPLPANAVAPPSW